MGLTCAQRPWQICQPLPSAVADSGLDLVRAPAHLPDLPPIFKCKKKQ